LEDVGEQRLARRVDEEPRGSLEKVGAQRRVGTWQVSISQCRARFDQLRAAGEQRRAQPFWSPGCAAGYELQRLEPRPEPLAPTETQLGGCDFPQPSLPRLRSFVGPNRADLIDHDCDNADPFVKRAASRTHQMQEHNQAI
jgi:hypothetical protein